MACSRVMSRGDDADLPKLLNQATAIRLLTSHGWTRERGGNHVVKMTKPGMRPITLPAARRQDYSRGLTRRILEAAGLLPRPTDEG